MTLEQIRKMMDQEINEAVCRARGWGEFRESPYNGERVAMPPGACEWKKSPPHSTDLNAAMSLVPHYTLNESLKELTPQDRLGYQLVRGFLVSLAHVCDSVCGDQARSNHEIGESDIDASMVWWFLLSKNKPRALCEAYLLWKDGDK